MNNAMDEKAIEEYFTSIGKTLSDNFICGYVEPNDLDLPIFESLSYVSVKSFIISFDSNEIIMVPLSPVGNFQLDEEPIIIKKENIDRIKVKKGIIQYALTIFLRDDKFKIKMGKKIISHDWHSNNLKYLIENNWFMPNLLK